MNYLQLKSAIKYIQKNCPCVNCNTKYKQGDIFVIATTKTEALFELHCENCKKSSMINLVSESPLNTKTEQRVHRKIPQRISENDILDMRNFLTNFDGNFKKIFKQ